MRLLPCGTPIKGEKRRTFRHGFLSELVMVGIVVVAPLVGLWHQRADLLGISGLKLLFVGPIALAVFLLWLLIAVAVLHSLRSSLRGSNWIMMVTGKGVFLNLRSFRNAHFGGEDTTVLQLAFSEIKSAGSLLESVGTDVGDTARTTFKRTLELTLGSADTEALAEAIRAEVGREPPTNSFLGVTSRTKFHHQPVLVPRPGVIQVEWKRGMLYALEGRVRVIESRRVDANAIPQEVGFDERLERQLVRGNQLQALSLVRDEFSLDFKEAKDWIESHKRHSA